MGNFIRLYCLIFYTYDSELQSIGNNTMKKMLLCYWHAGLAYYRTAQQTFTVQNKPAAVAPKETITHHFFVSELGVRKKNCRWGQNLWRRRNKKETENPANIRKWIARFYYFSIYTPLEARVLLHNNCMSCPSMGNSICTAY